VTEEMGCTVGDSPHVTLLSLIYAFFLLSPLPSSEKGHNPSAPQADVEKTNNPIQPRR